MGRRYLSHGLNIKTLKCIYIDYQIIKLIFKWLTKVMDLSME